MKVIHPEIKAALLRRFRDLPLDARLPSYRDLAREYNVALLTINRVMGDLEREGYVVRRPNRGTFLASRERTVVAVDDEAPAPNGSVALAYPHYFSYHYWHEVDLAGESAQKHGLRLHEYKLRPASTPEQLLGFLRKRKDVRGLLLLPVAAFTAPASLALLDGLGLPVVLLSTSVDVAPYRNLHAVDLDWQEAGRLGMDALLAAGHRRVAWVNHAFAGAEAMGRGIRQALSAHGLRASDLLTVGNGTPAWADSRVVAMELAGRLLDAGEVTGAFFDTTGGVRGALRALWERGRRAPEDLSMVANGNQSGDEEFLAPPLTTVEGDRAAEMRAAFAALLEPPPADRRRIIPVRLCPRRSIAPPAR
jgi:DNA-binding LacI/PurR family transcriptional regulator